MVGKSAIVISVALLAGPLPAAAGTYTQIYTQIYTQAATTDQPQIAFFGPSGVLYGVTRPAPKAAKGSPVGSIFSLTPPASGTSWTYATLYRFPSKCACAPIVTTQDAAGNLYGYTVPAGKKAIPETIFKFNPTTRTLTTLYTAPRTGVFSNSVVSGGDGNLYLSTSTSIEALPTAGGALTGVYTFTFAPDAGGVSALLSDGEGNLYGTLLANTSVSPVAAFEVNVASKSLVYQTPLDSTVAYELNSFVLDSSGTLWGSSNQGGATPPAFGYGTIYSFNPSSQTPSVAYDFSTTCKPSCSPSPVVVMGPNNVLYGIANGPGYLPKSWGTLYRYDTVANVYSTLYVFSKAQTIGGPVANTIAIDGAGATYGTYLFSSKSATGTEVVWQITP